MAYLQLRGIEKFFGEHRAIKGIDLSIQKGEFIVFVGPSGCGKSTLLRLIAGLEAIDGGTLMLDGRMLSRTDVVIAGMVVIGFTGFVTDRLLVILNNRLLKWSPQHHV